MIDPAWSARHYPALRLDQQRVWNPAYPEQEMLLDSESGAATLSWPHCRQTFRRGEAEDFSSWDDHSQPWYVDWATWRDGWLAALRDGTGHVRPGHDRLRSGDDRPWLALIIGTLVWLRILSGTRTIF